MDGIFVLFFVDVRLDEFVIFKCHDGPMFRMAGQAGFCLVRDAPVFRSGGEGGQQNQGKKKQCSEDEVLSFSHSAPCSGLGSSAPLPRDVELLRSFQQKLHQLR